jgi:glycine/D-amino acid oxidase-like deaminating enzyme
MTTWLEYIQEHGSLPEWPYPICYGQETAHKTDVLVLGGGIAGCHAAINARKAGADVLVLEKGATKWRGGSRSLALCLHQSLFQGISRRIHRESDRG